MGHLYHGYVSHNQMLVESMNLMSWIFFLLNQLGVLPNQPLAILYLTLLHDIPFLMFVHIHKVSDS